MSSKRVGHNQPQTKPPAQAETDRLWQKYLKSRGATKSSKSVDLTDGLSLAEERILGIKRRQVDVIAAQGWKLSRDGKKEADKIITIDEVKKMEADVQVYASYLQKISPKKLSNSEALQAARKCFSETGAFARRKLDAESALAQTSKTLGKGDLASVKSALGNPSENNPVWRELSERLLKSAAPSADEAAKHILWITEASRYSGTVQRQYFAINPVSNRYTGGSLKEWVIGFNPKSSPTPPKVAPAGAEKPQDVVSKKAVANEGFKKAAIGLFKARNYKQAALKMQQYQDSYFKAHGKRLAKIEIFIYNCYKKRNDKKQMLAVLKNLLERQDQFVGFNKFEAKVWARYRDLAQESKKKPAKKEDPAVVEPPKKTREERIIGRAIAAYKEASDERTKIKSVYRILKKSRDKKIRKLARGLRESFKLRFNPTGNPQKLITSAEVLKSAFAAVAALGTEQAQTKAGLFYAKLKSAKAAFDKPVEIKPERKLPPPPKPVKADPPAQPASKHAHLDALIGALDGDKEPAPAPAPPPPPPPPKPPEKEVDEVAKLVRAIQDHKPQMRVAIKPVKKDEPRKAPAVAPKRDDVRAKKMAARAQEMSNLADRLNKMRTSAESLFTEGKFRAARIKYEGYKKEYQDSYKQKQALIEYQIAACYINEGNKAKGRSILRNLLANPGRFEGEVPKRAKPLFARLNAALSRRMVDSGPTVKIPRRRLSRERQSAAVSRKVGFFFKNSIRRYFVKRVGKSIAANFSVEIDILSSGMVRVRKLRVNSFSGRLPQESFEKKLKDFIESNLRFEPIRGKTESIKIDNQPIKVG